MNIESILPIELLITEANKLAISLSEDQAKQLVEYTRILIEYDRHTNLVGNPDPERLLYDHILDSFTLLPIIEKLQKNKRESLSLIDIGTGAGFPGIVLAIVKPNLYLTAVDATLKKITFLKNVVQDLELNKRVRVVQGRAEELAHDKKYRAVFDYVTCRALGSLPMVCELTLPFLKIGGRALLQRGAKKLADELEQAGIIMTNLGASLEQKILLDKADKELYILVLKQDKRIAPKYPRSWKEIKV